MRLSDTRPKAPYTKFTGSKWKLAKDIAAYIPPHKARLFPCLGSGGLFFQLPKIKVETVNDLDNTLVTTTNVIMKNPKELQRQLRMTLWSRHVYKAAIKFMHDQTVDDMERARLFIAYCTMSVMPFGNPGFRVIKHPDDRHNAPAMDLQRIDLGSFSERLIGVQVEELPAQKVIKKYDTIDTFIFFDPPYLPEVRESEQWQYNVEMTVKDHIECAEILRDAKGMSIVCGYKSGLYHEIYEQFGWQRVDLKARQNGGQEIIESIWLSPTTQQRLNDDFTDLPIFTKKQAF